jgi:hypothetical protein
LEIGLTRDDILEMGWGEVVMMLQVYTRSHSPKDEGKKGSRKATDREVMAWAGM